MAASNNYRMTSKERVIKAVHFDYPHGLPLYFFNRDRELSDIVSTGIGKASSFKSDYPDRTEWGYLLKPYKGTMGQPEDPFFAAGWDVWNRFSFPDGRDGSRLSHVPAFIKENEGRFVTLSMGLSGFTNACFTRGTQAFLEDMLIEPEMVERLLEKIFTYENEIIKSACQMGVDGIEFYDDFGTQNGMLFSPGLFRKFFVPFFKEQFALIHRYSKMVYFHSCGDIWDIIGDLIGCGADVLNLNQPDLLGVERLGAEYGGKICFACPVDHQTVAINGTPEEAEAYIDKLYECLGGESGGLIGLLEDYACCGMSENNYQAIKKKLLEKRK